MVYRYYSTNSTPESQLLKSRFLRIFFVTPQGGWENELTITNIGLTQQTDKLVFERVRPKLPVIANQCAHWFAMTAFILQTPI